MPISKVAKVTASFWILKIFATTLGETAGDLLSMTLQLGYAASTALLMGLFLVALTLQLRTRHFHPVLYWFVILTTLIAGTTLSDFMDRTLGLGYTLGSVILMSTLAAILVAWRMTQKSLSVENIATPRAEIFYWSAILVSNTLGTALGDFLADDSGLGFLGGATLIGSLLALLALAYRLMPANHVFLFWAAFILTRPFGATFGDLLTKTAEKGGMELGTIGSSAVLGVLCAAMLTYMIWSDAQKGRTTDEQPAPDSKPSEDGFAQAE